MSFFTRFSLRNPAAIVLLSLLVAVGGWFSATKFKQEQMPEVAYPYISVVAVYPGAAPAEVLSSVTVPLEKALRGVEGVKNVTSSSSNSVSGLQLEFSFSDNMEVKKQKVDEAVWNVKLPDEVVAPKVESFSTSNQAALYTSVFAKEGVNPEELSRLVESKVLPELSGIEGVSKLETAGLKEGGVYLTLDAAKLEAKQVGYQQVAAALGANNLNVPLGEVTLEQVNTPVLISGSIKNAEELQRVAVAPGVRVSDVGTVTVGKDTQVISRTNGQPSVSINVFKTGDANTVEVSAKVLQVYDDLKKDGKLDTLILYDRAVEVKESVSSMMREGGLGALFASILILFFLRNLRATLIAVVSIPLSILVAMIALKTFTDVTLNIMTLGGMAVATGRVVDDSIVVIENIVRRLQKEKPSMELIHTSTMEVGRAITASTITTIAVFAPLGLVQGLVGEFFRPFALTVGFSLAASLLVALTIVPLLSWVLMKKHIPAEHSEPVISQGYKKALRWSLNHKAIVMVGSLLLFAGSLPLSGLVGLTFLPETDYKYVFADYSMPKGTELSVVDAEAKRIDELLRSSDQVTATNVSVGQNNNGAILTNKAFYFIALKSDANIKQFMEDMRPKISVPAGSAFDFQEDMGGGQVAITVTGPDTESIRKGAAQITETIKGIEGTANAKNNLLEGTKGIDIQVRGDDAAKHGLSVGQAAQLLRPLFNEQKLGRIGQGSDSSELHIAVRSAGAASVDAIASLKLPTPQGTVVQVKDIADVLLTQLPSDLQLKNGSEFATVTASITDKNTSKINGKVKDALKALELPQGVEYSMGGSNEEINGMLSDMLMAMAVACGMVYIVMVVTFREARAPLAILFSLPFAFVGGLVGTWAAGQPISVSSLIGFLMLIGIVVTNAIVLVERVHQQLEQGATIRDALIEAGGTRLRPILMTAIATIFALLPLAMGLGGGSIISGGLAVIVIGGLATSTLLTLVMVPVMYELFHFRRSRRERQAQAAHTLAA